MLILTNCCCLFKNVILFLRFVEFIIAVTLPSILYVSDYLKMDKLAEMCRNEY